MKSTHKVSLLAAAALSVAAATQAHAAFAAFTYDLRFAPGQGQTDAHNIDLSSSGGTYTVQLWGQITGDTDFTNDGWVKGYVSILSSQVNGGGFTSGGFNAASGTLGTHVNNVALGGANIGVGGLDRNLDGINDWGTTLTSSSAGWTVWGAGASPGFVDNGPAGDAQSEQAGPNTWEVLLATYTITPGAIGAQASGTTTFTPSNPTKIQSGVSQVNGIAYYPDNANVSPTPPATTAVGTPGSLVFHAAPEPTSLGLLALGGLALVNRRRRA